MLQLSRKATTFEAFVTLLFVDCSLAIMGVLRFLSLVQSFFPPSKKKERDQSRLEDLTDAFMLAYRLYFRPVHCLQRSLTIYLMARRRGLTVRFCIGAKKYPFTSHAWIE